MAENDELHVSDRKNPPAFPMGFRFAEINGICTIDFIDIPTQNGNVFSSIAITKSQAKDLVSSLNRFIGEEIDQ